MKKRLILTITAAILLFLTIFIIINSLSGKKNKTVEAPTEASNTERPTSTISADNITNDSSATDIDTTTEESSEFRIAESYIDNMAPATSVDGIKLTDDILDNGILNSGNTSRIEDCMIRASKGEALTIAYIGGSITNGSSASPQATSCYAYLSTQWWKETFPDSNITYINAGIGATDSYLGVHRAYDDVISHSPDLVIVEFSVNDTMTLNKETYDSLIRLLLTSDSSPAVISLLLAQESGSFAKDHAPVAFKYSITIISYSALLSKNLINWNDVGSTDGVHPKNSGHQMIAYLLTSYYRNVLSSINDHESIAYEVPDLSSALTKCRYIDSTILYSDIFTASQSEDFEACTVWDVLSDDNGWSTDSAGSISFEITASEIGVIYVVTDEYSEENDAVYELYIDDRLIGKMQAYQNTWGRHLLYLSEILGDEPAPHNVLIKPASDNTGKNFTITGIAVSGFSPDQE